MNIIKKNKLLFIVSLIYIVLFITNTDKAIESTQNSIYYVLEMLQIMPVIFILTSLIEAWVPKEVIMNSFGEKSGIKGSMISFILGSFSAGPIYAAFPVCKTLIKKGASISNVVIILSTWAVVKVPMLANEAKFLGTKFMSIRWILTTISIFIMAYIVSVFVKKESIPNINNNTIKNRVIIKQEYCIGCGICERISPTKFKVLSGKVKILSDIIDESTDEAIERCPVKVIDYV
ncbi:permease [Alkalithermobacter paradoxus]|uniref:Putative permease n=1 Tax=Alkalithermobacter paradoxus TaxID=29349 RepID=A0A1V4I9Z2_9FIRM|nr:putative permease [[Clostridium] thermoalcaliphilum]